MTTPHLGRLEQVDLRSAWANEAGDFTPWLAQDENLSLLGQTIGIDLELEAQERNVGLFRADILCKATASNTWVLIENQLERTDHSHLGQLLTYAAGLDAVTIVWVAAHFTDEHRAALDWLNEKTDDSVNLFALEIELWRIGNSGPAPKFNIVSKPNDWSKSVATSARGLESGALNPAKELQQEYWLTFLSFIADDTLLRPQSARPEPYMYFSSGAGGAEYIARFSSRTPWLQVCFSLNTRRSDQGWFPLLLAQRDEIDAELGHRLDWNQPRDDVKENRMAVRLDDADYRDRSDWPRQHAWLHKELDAFYRVFGPRLRTLPKLGSLVLPEAETAGS